MDKFKFLICVFWFFLFFCFPVKKSKALWKNKHAAEVQTEEEKMSYMLGYILTENTKKSESNLQSARLFFKG